MTDEPIMSEARDYVTAWRALPYPAEIAPSELWRNHIAAQLDPILNEVNSPDTVVERVTGGNITTDPLATDSPLFKQVSSAFLQWLQSFGRPLQSFPPTVQESVLAAPKVVAMNHNRRYSTAFLYHLSIAAHMEAHVDKYDSVLEIGAGHGGLPRLLKLLNPQAKFVLVDLPETLCLCYIFLRRHFPNCTFEAITRREQLSGKERSADFTFVPAQLAAGLAGSSFDVAINTASLSEMTQSAADWYIKLIENDLHVHYFCHLNRFGTPETYLGNACSTSFGLDRNWEVLSWQWRGKDNLTNLHPEWPPLLNLVLRRIPERIRSDVLFKGLSDSLRSTLPTVAPNSDEWFVTMWDLIRIDGNKADIEAYLDVIRPAGWRETPYYESLLATAKAA
jgi:putative sugar O-methyltransferase